VLGDIAPGEGTVGQDGQARLASFVQDGGNQVAAQAAAAELGVGFGVEEGDLVCAALVLHEPTPHPVHVDLVAFLARVIGYLLSQGVMMPRPVGAPALRPVPSASRRCPRT
jgi:hypothetical protein